MPWILVDSQSSCALSELPAVSFTNAISGFPYSLLVYFGLFLVYLLRLGTHPEMWFYVSSESRSRGHVSSPTAGTGPRPRGLFHSRH